MPQNEKISQQAWLYASLAGFVLFLLFFFGLIFYGKEVNISSPVYFFLIVVVALFSTAFLSGAMRSVAKYNASFDNKTLMIAGPAVIFFIILYFGFKYKPETKGGPITLSILVTGPSKNNEVIRNGEVGVRVGDLSIVKKINNEGIAFFSGIDADYKGKPIDVFPLVEGYHLDTAQKFFLVEGGNSTNLSISLIKNLDSISIRGKIMLLKNQHGIAEAQITFEGVDNTYVSDESGSFTAVLPLKSGSEIRVMITKGNAIIYNSMRTLTDKALLTFPVSEQ